MTLEPIGDIANGGLTDNTVEGLAWGAASDWDNAVSESGVVHEDRIDTAGAGTVKMGVPSDLHPDLFTLHLFQDKTGDLADVIGTNGSTGDGNVNKDQTGRANSRSWQGQSDSAYVNIDNSSGDFDTPGGNDTMAVAFWAKIDGNSSGSNPRTIGTQDNGYRQYTENDTGDFHWKTDSDDVEWTGFNPAWDGTEPWHLFVLGRDSGNVYIYMDNTQQASAGSSGTAGTNGGTLTYFNKGDGGLPDAFNGRLDDVAWFSSWIGSSTRQALYDAGTTATLTTATKSVGSSIQPDLANLSYALNGESITIDAIGSPGTASEEIVSQTLDGASSYTLTWSNGHTDFRLKLTLDTTDPTVSPTLSNAELQG